jgi:hypothetical protein
VSRRAGIVLALSLSGIIVIFLTAAVLDDRSAESEGTVSDAAPSPGPTITTDAPGPTITTDVDDAVHVIAPPGKCWQLGLGHSLADSGARVEQGCGATTVTVDATHGVRAQLGPEPRGWWDIGMKIQVDGAIVRDIRPAPYGGMTVHYADELPERTIDVRLMAPEDGCWTATIEDELRDGCGGLTLPLRIRGDINVVFERTPPAAWTWCLVVEADGEIVQTVGPDSNPDYPLGFWHGPAEISGNPPALQIEPVTC